MICPTHGDKDMLLSEGGFIQYTKVTVEDDVIVLSNDGFFSDEGDLSFRMICQVLDAEGKCCNWTTELPRSNTFRWQHDIKRNTWTT